MGELHDSMAYSSSSLHSPSLGWDIQNLGVFNADMSLVMDGITAPLFPHLDSDFSSGYLEDALLEFSTERSKRRRLLLYSDHDHQTNGFNDFAIANSYWNSSCNCGQLSENFSCMSQLTSINGVSSDEPMSTSVSSVAEMKTPEAISGSHEALDSPSSSYKGSVKTKSFFKNNAEFSTDDPISSSGSDDKKMKKRVIRSTSTKVVYPFALVKPGGIEGDMTLNDINERILMAPTRPVRHPVGDFACRPCVSADGPGLSGKAVVALTKIQTQGRGTITIIRTKG